MKIKNWIYILCVLLVTNSCKKDEHPSEVEIYELSEEVLVADSYVYNLVGNKLSFYTDLILLDPDKVFGVELAGDYYLNPEALVFANSPGFIYQFDSLEFVYDTEESYSAMILLGKGDDARVSSHGLNYFLKNKIVDSEVAICTFKKDGTDSVELSFYGDNLMGMPINNSDYLFEAYGGSISGENYTLDAIYKSITHLSENGKYSKKYIVTYFEDIESDTSYHNLTEVVDYANANNVHLIMLPKYDDEYYSYEIAKKTDGLFCRYGNESVDFSLGKILAGHSVKTRLYISIDKSSSWTGGWLTHSFDYKDLRIYYKIWH